MILHPFKHFRKDLIASPGVGRNFLFYLLYYNYRDNFRILPHNEFFANLYCISEVKNNSQHRLLTEQFLKDNMSTMIEYKKIFNAEYASISKDISIISKMGLFAFYFDFFINSYNFVDRDASAKEIDFDLKLKIHNELLSKLDFSFIDSKPYVCNFHDPYYLAEFDVHIPNYEIVAIEPREVDSMEQILTLCTIKHIHSDPTLTAEDMFRISKGKQQVF